MNRLASESSLYLRQHANNPVDWHPWGDEAIDLAMRLDRPIFLSVGYSACHWCHVMEHESFENAETARFLNEHFISIKVDREERPDVDHLYMTALQAMTREGGGWPLSVWLTPDLRPFYAGTYYPPDDRYGAQRPSFPRLLAAINNAWQTQRSEIVERAAAIAEHLNRSEHGEPAESFDLGVRLLEDAGQALLRGFDPVNGGFGRAPKFPHALELRLLLRIAHRTGRNELLHVVKTSLDQMSRGGIYDQVGGGFHRYSTDARWLVPHFEKMLYDNALLVPAYVDAWQATHDPEYRRIAIETLDYVTREMISPVGAFYSTQDADSEGEEGKFYVWSQAEIETILGPEESPLFIAVHGVSGSGNFEGHNILHRTRSWDELAARHNLPAEEIRARVKQSAGKLYQGRSRRVWPGRDEKILTSWNALMIAAFAKAGAVFGESIYVEAAGRAADFLLTTMRAENGSLYRTCAVGSPPRIAGFLEDYACLSNALVDLYEATFDTRWIGASLSLAEEMIERFGDPGGGFFTTCDDHRHLIARSKDRYDGSTPSGNSMAVTALVRLMQLTGRNDLREAADKTIRWAGSALRDSPSGSAQMLAALDLRLGPVSEIVVICPKNSAEKHKLLSDLRGRYLPNTIVICHDSERPPQDEQLLPLLQGKHAKSEIVTYLCQDQACRAPLTGVHNALAALDDFLVH